MDIPKIKKVLREKARKKRMRAVIELSVNGTAGVEGLGKYNFLTVAIRENFSSSEKRQRNTKPIQNWSATGIYHALSTVQKTSLAGVIGAF